MSIQPNRVLARIIEQVEQSDWLRLTARVVARGESGEWIRLFDEPRSERYATPFHFWVHALRDDLAARGRVEDLVPVAGHALCRTQSVDGWRAELAGVWPEAEGSRTAQTIYLMQANECRRSSVALYPDRLITHFWGHGCEASWRRRG
jgi:hypothetical protein